MKRIVKIIGLLLVAVFALLVAAAVAITLFVDPNDYRDEIATYVEEKTGRPFELQGELSLSLFPWIGLETGPAQLGNAPGFGDQPFARVEEVGIKVQLLPLLRKELVMDTVILDGMVLNLTRNEQGKGNWEGLAGEPGPEPEPPPEEPSPAGGLAGFAVSGVNVSNARIVWEDRQTGTHMALQELDLTTGQLGGAEPVDVKLEFDLVDQPEGRPRHFELTSDVLFDLQQGTLNMSDLLVKFAGVELAGSVQGKDVLGESSFTGRLAVAEFVPRRVLQELEIELPETTDPTVLGKAVLETEFSATTSAAELNDLMLRLDDSTLTGTLAVRDFAKQALRFDLDLDQIDLDRYLPPPEEEPTRASAGFGLISSAVAAEPPAADDGPLIPVDLIRGLDVEGELRIAELKAYNLRSEQVRMVVSAKNGSVRVHPSQAQLYGGSYSGDVRIDARGKQPLISMNETLEGVQAQPLLKDAADTDLLSGTAKVTAQLAGTATTMEQLRRSLNGTIAMAFTDGSIKGVNIPNLIRKANATIRGQPAPPEEPEQTDFTQLTATAAVRNGVADNRDLQLQSPLLRVTGAGTANLVEETVDYTLKAVIVASLEGQGGAALESLKGVPIPVRIEGPFAEPGFKVDLAQVLTEQQKQRLEQEVEEKKEEVREEVEEKLKDRLGDQFKGLFKK